MAGGHLIDIGITVGGVDAVMTKLGAMKHAVDDLRPVFDEVYVKVYQPWIATRFKSGGRKGWKGSTFPAWDDYTGEPKYEARKRGILKQRRAAVGKGIGILRWGAAQNAPVPGPREWLTASFIGRGAQTMGIGYHVKRIGRHNFEVGSDLPWAATNNYGTGTQPFDDVPMKRRQIIVNDRALLREVVLRVQRYIVKKDRAAGRAAFATGRFTQASIQREFGA